MPFLALDRLILAALLEDLAAMIAVFWLLRSGAEGPAPEDWRYAEFRRLGWLYWPVSFLGFHLFPTAIVFLGCLSLFPALGSTGRTGRALGIFDAAAAAVTLTAMFLFISVPMMDRHLLARRPEYASLISRRSGLVPWLTIGPSGSPRRRTTRRGNYTEPRGRA